MRRTFRRLSTDRSPTCSLSMQREEDSGSESARCITGKLIEDVLCCSPIAVAMADLLENDHSLFIENECRRVGRLMRRVPTQSIQIGDLVVRIRHKNNIGWQISLLFEEFLRMLIQILGRQR